MTHAQQFEDLRPWLFAIAYRLVGSVADAEDAVQDTWLRWAGADDEPVTLKPYLATIITRICLDLLRSARHRRETYVGPELPEPLPTGPSGLDRFSDPERAAELSESVSVASLLLLERLSPLERAAYVLHDVFAFGFDDIATVLERSAPACRQLAARARVHLAEGRRRYDADAAQHRELARRFFAALRDGAIEPLQALLADDVAAINDSGGEAGGAGGTFPRVRMARILAGAVTPLLTAGARIEQREFNGSPGAVLIDADGDVLGTWTLEIAAGAVQTIHSVTNPRKLAHLGPVGDLHAMRRAAQKVRRREGESSR